MVPSNSTEKSWNEKLGLWHHLFVRGGGNELSAGLPPLLQIKGLLLMRSWKSYHRTWRKHLLNWTLKNDEWFSWKRISVDEEAEKLDSELEESTSLEIDNKKWWRVTQLKKRLLLISEGRETRKKEEWAVKEGSLPQRRRKMFGPLDNTKDHSLLQGSHQHLLLLSLTNPVFHLTHSSIAWFSTFLS